MTYPRSHLVDSGGGIYHLGSRCVRRAFLCGNDPVTGLNFDHRRKWLEDRILTLSEIFAVDLYGYAVMSNHYHIVLNLDPGKLSTWSDEQIATKWLALFPPCRSRKNADGNLEHEKTLVLNNKPRLKILRERLGSLSWYMRCLNEPIARKANKEDGCKGRFWEGRFDSQRVLDTQGLLACMVYVDLNPMRVGLAEDVLKMEHTSLMRRLQTSSLDAPITPLNENNTDFPINLPLSDYVSICKWTLVAQQEIRPVSLTVQTMANYCDSLMSFAPTPGRWQRALGSQTALRQYAKSLGQHWLKTYYNSHGPVKTS